MTGHVRWGDLIRILLVALAAAATWFQICRPWGKPELLAIAATAIGAYPIAKEALGALLARRMTMELSMTIAFGAALAIGEYFTALLIVLFVLIAEVLEHLTVGRGRLAIKELLDFLPQQAVVRRQSESLEVGTAELRTGDIVIVKPGARIPVDGAVVGGNSFVDQSMITGESLPAEKVAGSRVYAGSINQSGTIDISAEGIGRETAFGRIIEAVERAEKSRAPIQKTADRLAGYLVYVAFACATATYLVTRNMRTTISVVIVAGACGIAAGTPLAILGAIGQVARRGLIVKGGLYLEMLWAIDTVVLDKTGTLTFGNPEVTNLCPVDGTTPEELLMAAAIAERPSEHPLGKAILKKATGMSLSVVEPENFQYTPGKGIVCSSGGQEILVGNRAFLADRGIPDGLPKISTRETSEILVARSGRCLGSIHLADVLRPEAVEAVRRLRGMALRTVLLSGDQKAVADAVGKALGVDEIAAELLPEEKLLRVRTMMGGGRKVAMIGDGINDVPSLVEANVGIAMGSGTDIARESAPVTLIGNNLLKFAEAIQVARRCRRIIMTNFVGTLVVDGVGVGLSAFGLLGPVLAALIHVSSELLFLLNSARLV
ncbi:MAG TPA: cation-translocating P-type ATPase, partial [Planctomycetota bacterium]|nr:cation-translocating P-type ATPase [Planctomycetota bacterium]